MSLIMTFMFEPAKLQMNWARASGTSTLRSDPVTAGAGRGSHDPTSPQSRPPIA